MAGMQDVLAQQMQQVTSVIEDQLDAEINKLDNMGEDDYEQLKKKRMAALKKAEEEKKELLMLGHGKYSEIPDEKAFFEVVNKKSKRVVCHFYRDSTERCKIVDMHLEKLARKHIETKFIKINAEKCEFLCQRLRIVVIPTICLVKDGKTEDYVVGFTELGNQDDFKTELLEWRIARHGIINYSGDLLHPPGSELEKKKPLLGHQTKKTIRDDGDDTSDDDYD